METIASLIVLVAAVSAIAGWIATGSERISYAGFQIAFAFFLSMFQGYAPDTDLDKIRDRVVGILIGLAVTTVIFHYIWPECARESNREPNSEKDVRYETLGRKHSPSPGARTVD
jgi:multidrug resistance protein MdtO